VVTLVLHITSVQTAPDFMNMEEDMMMNVPSAPVMQGTPMAPDSSMEMQPQMPMGEVSQMEVQEAQQGLIQILQVIETLIQQGLTEDEILALLAQYGITEAELEQAAQVLGVDMEQLLGGAQMEQPQMETPQQPMMMANGGPSTVAQTSMINSALQTIKDLATQQMAPSQNMQAQQQPMFQSRTSDEQIFSLNAEINNLMNDYNIAIRDQDFDTAQAIADQINNIDVLITQLKSQNVPQMGMGLGQKKN